MEKLLTTTSAYLLKPGRDQLCNEVYLWRTELEFCSTEISFFAKLLDKSNHVIINPGDYKEMEQQLVEVNSIRHELLSDLLGKVVDHEAMLLQMVENDSASDLEEKTLFNHHELKAELSTFISEFKMLKQKIFAVVEKNVLLAKKAKETVKTGRVVF